MKKNLPIGNDQFREIRESEAYYIDKTMMIGDFLAAGDKVALITRPRRFGKTLNMTMIREFFDITKDSSVIFSGLAIMETPYAAMINSKPVIFFSFKDCTGNTAEDLRIRLSDELLKEYVRYGKAFADTIDRSNIYVKRFYRNTERLAEGTLSFAEMISAIADVLQVVCEYYQSAPILLIDEYDQPVLSSYENGYRQELGEFFANFYGVALKGNPYLGQALLTGIQRVAKESIFSKLNNIVAYTVIDDMYATYFGLTEAETGQILRDYEMVFDDAVKRKYDGYRFGKMAIYNPWSILNYLKYGEMRNYWVNTSTNYLVKQALDNADTLFMESFQQLISDGVVEVGVNLETSFIELQNSYSLWGLLVNSGYLTVTDIRLGKGNLMTLQIPNDEVSAEFQQLVAERAHVANDDLNLMFDYLTHQDMDNFMKIYSELVMTCTSSFDAKENAYHMLFLGMCITLRGMYKVSSNLETGLGRSDIMLESLSKQRCHVIIEFKYGEQLEALKEKAIQQIQEKQYYAGLSGKIMCVGIAHNKKQCAVAYKMIAL